MAAAIIVDVTTTEEGEVRGGEMQAVSMQETGRGGTWALRLGEVAGDNLPDAGRQAGGLTVLGRVLHTQARLLTRPQDTALQRLWRKREGLWGTWPGWEGEKRGMPRRPAGNPLYRGKCGS